MRPWPVLLVTAASAGVTAYLGFFAFLLLIYAQPQLFVVVALLAGAQVAFWKWTENRAAAWSLAQTVAALAGYSLGYVALLVAGFVVLRVPVYVE